MIQNSMNIPFLHKDNAVGKRKVRKRAIHPTIALPPPIKKKVHKR